MSNVLTVAGLYSGGNINVMYTTDTVTYNTASSTNGVTSIDLATEYPESTVLFIAICSHAYVCQVTGLVASMAAPTCRSRQTISSFPNLAALISSVSPLS